MNTLARLSLLWLIVASCAPAAPAPTPAPTSQAYSVAVIAHRGGAALAPENTLAAFRNALRLGVDYLEMDAHLSADGAVVIIHDATLERTTDGTGRVAGRTLAQLHALNAAARFPGWQGAPEPVPSLPEVLDLARDSRVRIEIEIKLPPGGRYAGIEERLLAAVAERGLLGRVQISSFDFGVLRDVKRLDPQARTVALMTSDFFRRVPVDTPDRVIAEAQSVGAEVIAVNKEYLNQALVQSAHARHISVEVWTVDGESDMIRLAQMGVDGIITNRPDLLRRAAGH